MTKRLEQSIELCRWIIDNLLTEEQLDVIPKGYDRSIRMSVKTKK